MLRAIMFIISHILGAMPTKRLKLLSPSFPSLPNHIISKIIMAARPTYPYITDIIKGHYNVVLEPQIDFDDLYHKKAVNDDY